MKLKKGLSIVAVLLLLSVVLIWLAWQRVSSAGAPQRDGEASLAGLTAAVTVRWDRWAVPHLLAANARDASAALGWLHANDRMTQLELGRRAASGRLSEVVGTATVNLDREARVLRLRKAAETLWSSASPASREMLEAYAEGVNAWLASHERNLPPGLRILRIKPEPWTPVDSLCFALIMAKDLSFWQGRPEEDRFGWLARFGPEMVRQWLGDPNLEIPEGLEPFLEAARKKNTAAPSAATAESPGTMLAGWEPAALGSNAWVIGPGRTAGGAAILANDPHLGLGLPSIWYQVHIRSPGYEVAGMTIPGLPGVVIGRNADLAWGFTNTMLDDHDIYFEELDEAGTKVRRGDDWVPLQVETEVIQVRGGEPVSLEVKSTDRGPLLRAWEDRGLPARSLAWTAYWPADPVAALANLARATTLDEARLAIRDYSTPGQNLMVAHRDGGILYTVLGWVPDRLRGDGRMPMPGWDLSYGWKGARSQETNPVVLSPEEGFLVTANNNALPADYPLSFSADFDEPYRAHRIRDLLQSRTDWTATDQETIQGDVVSLYALEVVRLAAGPYEGDAAKAYEALAAWDGAMTLNGPPALFDFFHEALQEGAFLDEEEQYQVEPLRGKAPLVHLLAGELGESWFDDVRTEAVETRGEILSRALASAWKEGSQKWGEDVAQWSYGAIHTLTLFHPIGQIPVLGKAFNRGPFPTVGCGTCVDAMAGPWWGGRRIVRFGPSMRWVVDFSNPEEGLAALPGGQSGHLKDPHYDDQIDLFLKGQLRPAPWSEGAIEGATVSTLELHP